MYELFVLGELMTGDKHGYMLQDILKNAVGRVRPISSGTLYPLLARLTESGLIRIRLEEETEGGRPRKIYALTDAGRERFRELMRKPLDPKQETELTFRFKMVYFQYVDKELRLACLEQYRQCVEAEQRHVARFEAMLRASKPEPEKQRLQLLRVFDHRKALGSADLAWVCTEIERVRNEEN